jgi:hypothetical protein
MRGLSRPAHQGAEPAPSAVTLERKEVDVPHFTEDNLQRIIINPFYAITIAPQLTQEHLYVIRNTPPPFSSQ